MPNFVPLINNRPNAVRISLQVPHLATPLAMLDPLDPLDPLAPLACSSCSALLAILDPLAPPAMLAPLALRYSLCSLSSSGVRLHHRECGGDARHQRAPRKRARPRGERVTASLPRGLACRAERELRGRACAWRLHSQRLRHRRPYASGRRAAGCRRASGLARGETVNFRLDLRRPAVSGRVGHHVEERDCYTPGRETLPILDYGGCCVHDRRNVAEASSLSAVCASYRTCHCSAADLLPPPSHRIAHVIDLSGCVYVSVCGGGVSPGTSSLLSYQSIEMRCTSDSKVVRHYTEPI